MTKEIAPYLAENYTKAGKVSLNVRVIPISELMVTSPDLKRMRIAIASPRLDNAVAAVFSLSRRSAAEAISKGLVFVNNMEAKSRIFILKAVKSWCSEAGERPYIWETAELRAKERPTPSLTDIYDL